MKWWLLYNLPGLLGSIPLYSMVDRDAYQPTGIVQWDGRSIFYGMELPKKQQRPLCLASRSGLDKSLVQLPWKHHWAVVKTPSCLMIMGDYTTHCNGKTIHEWGIPMSFLRKRSKMTAWSLVQADSTWGIPNTDWNDLTFCVMHLSPR